MNKIDELYLIINNLERIIEANDIPAHYLHDIHRSLKLYREELNSWLEIREEKAQSFSEGAYNDEKEESYNTDWVYYQD